MSSARHDHAPGSGSGPAVTAPRTTTAPASLPPEGLPGLDPAWSRLVRVPGRGIDAGVTRGWHCLDTAGELEALGVEPAGTILAVHGNPTWSFLWRRLAEGTLAAAAAGGPAWRLVAVDQLEMGFSERSGLHRTVAQRVHDLAGFADAVVGDGPVITIGHDWGGVVSLGWAVDHAPQLAGVALLNTAIHHPAGVPIPAPLRLARARGVLAASTVATPAFLETTLSLPAEPLPADVREAYRAPYRTAARRDGIGGFVADIPADASHESHAELERIAAGVARLEAPALLLWGPRDPIFGDRYLDDLVDRLPHARVHRFEGAGHLVAEERLYADAVLSWVGEDVAPAAGGLETPRPAAEAPRPAEGAAEAPPPADAEAFRPLWHRLDERALDDGTAVIDMTRTDAGEPRTVSWRQLHARVQELAAGLHRLGIRRGDRVSLLLQPGPTLTAVVYACLRIGAIAVVADAGLGVQGLSRAVRGAQPDVIIGEQKGLAAARALGWPGRRFSAGRLPRAAEAALGVEASLGEVARLGCGEPLPPEPAPADEAAVLFTSGSTGPAKGVVYTHAQLSALRDVLEQHLAIHGGTGLVTGFAPFALLGPALGTRSATPDMDVSAPRTLTASAVAAAVRASDARIVFLSPAAVLNVVATADALTDADRAALGRIETFLSTGAPIGLGMLRSIAALMPAATPRTPYGMTECLLVADITLAEVEAAATAPDEGVCVGRAIDGNRILISALDADGRAVGEPSAEPGVLGEVVIAAPHLKRGYDRLWLTDREAARGTEALDAGSPEHPIRWHRTGDVGHLDADGRLWIEGRLPHVLVTADGPLAPVGTEQDVEAVDAVRRAAVVGVGPHGLRQAVAVVESLPAARRPGLADAGLAAAVRASTAQPLAAVLVVPSLPTDVRHNSKIDRVRLSAWAERTLAGRTPGAP
ncbi:alpha/beta fold hydrolase [Agrococcus terreus]|uniref:Acyl-CoA synthetase n=1 Tax=Agrococcus terreus TaxID=574649 RepID=A0ABQ2KBG4_9MICO|nr:acyl-CoA synthetase [Agrococcus terreus]